jgi:hypothetical protein
MSEGILEKLPGFESVTRSVIRVSPSMSDQNTYSSMIYQEKSDLADLSLPQEDPVLR